MKHIILSTVVAALVSTSAMANPLQPENTHPDGWTLSGVSIQGEAGDNVIAVNSIYSSGNEDWHNPSHMYYHITYIGQAFAMFSEGQKRATLIALADQLDGFQFADASVDINTMITEVATAWTMKNNALSAWQDIVDLAVAQRDEAIAAQAAAEDAQALAEAAQAVAEASVAAAADTLADALAAQAQEHANAVAILENNHAQALANAVAANTNAALQTAQSKLNTIVTAANNGIGADRSAYYQHFIASESNRGLNQTSSVDIATDGRVTGTQDGWVISNTLSSMSFYIRQKGRTYTDDIININGAADLASVNILNAIGEAADWSYEHGWADGYEEGFDIGYVEGYDEGYDDGYQDGWDDAWRIAKDIAD